MVEAIYRSSGLFPGPARTRLTITCLPESKPVPFAAPAFARYFFP